MGSNCGYHMLVPIFLLVYDFYQGLVGFRSATLHASFDNVFVCVNVSKI